MKIINKYASYEYQLFERFEAGVVLTGAEVKSAKLGHVSLKDGFVKMAGNEPLLLNVVISPYKFANNENYDPKRTRKLLLHKTELLKLGQSVEAKGLTMVPTAMYLARGKIKVEIALARGKKEFEKREAKRRKDLDREAAKTVAKFK